jgi:4-amino-4-deoxy-L-arabinose transferase-like glycosyltransferase
MNTQRRILLALFSIAFGIRILFAALVGMHPSINPNPVTSEVLYGHEIASSTRWLTEPYSPRAPGYPFFLGMIFLLTGNHVWPAIIVQAILGGFMAVLLFKLGGLLGGWRVGLLSALWIALFVHHIYFSSLLLRDVLACFILTSLVLVLSQPFKKMRYSLVAGALYAYLIHIDPQYLILLPIFLLFILIYVSRHLTINIHYLILFLSFAVVVSMPWTIRNYFVYDRFVPVSLEANRFLDPVKKKIPAKLRAFVQTKTSSVSHSRLNRMKENAVEFWRVTKFGYKRDSANDAGSSPNAKPWSLRHNLINIASYGILLPFFMIGLISVAAKRNAAGILVGALTIAYFIMRVFTSGSERARLQIEPFIILLALYAVFELRDFFGKSLNSS